MSRTGPTDPGPGDPLVPWASVRATAVDGVAVHPLSDEGGTSLVAWPEVGEPVVLDHFTHVVWEQLDGHASVGDLADELVRAGFPAGLEPLAAVATAVHDLVVSGLATTSPGPSPPLPGSHRRTMAAGSTGGSRRVHHGRPVPSGPAAPPPPDGPHPPGAAPPIRLSVDRREVDVIAGGPSVTDWLRGCTPGSSASEPASPLARRVTVAPTAPHGVLIAVDGRPVDWAEETDAVDRVSAAVVSASGAMPPDAVVDLGPGWALTGLDVSSPDRHTTRRHRWHIHRYLDAHGNLLLPTTGAHRRWVEQGTTRPDDWRAVPVDALSLSQVGVDTSEVLADLASIGRASDRLLALRVLAGVVDRVDDGLPPSGDGGAPSAALDRNRSAHPWVDQLLALGRPDSIARSVKVRTGEVVTERWLVWLTPRPDLPPDQVRDALRAVGFPSDHAEPVAEAIGSGRQVVLGTDGKGVRAARKLYIEDPTPGCWAAVRDLIGPSPVTEPPTGPAHGDGDERTLPVFVAWKWWPGDVRIATYWMSPHHELAEVMPDHPDWVDVLTAFPIHEGQGPHLLLTESTGRRSLDLVLSNPAWGAELEPLLRRLAAVAGLDYPDRDALVETVGAERVVRVIGGLDSSGEPLATLYLEQLPLGDGPA